MAFRQFNIQLLPLNSRKTGEVGVAGYKKLFEILGRQVSAALKARTLDKSAFVLANETQFSPFYVHSETNYAHGAFIKYHRAQTVSDLYTARPLFQANPSAAAVSNSHELAYVFAYANHRFAIDERGGKLPSTAQLLRGLKHFLGPIAADYFPEYTLQVNLVAEQKALKTALAEAAGFRQVKVALTFQNGPRFDAQLDEMRDKNVHHVDIKASAERGALMPELPEWLRDFVEASTQYGEAFLSYVKEDGKRAYFKTADFPAKIAVRLRKNELWGDYVDRIYQKVLGVTQPTNPAAKTTPVAKKAT